MPNIDRAGRVSTIACGRCADFHLTQFESSQAPPMNHQSEVAIRFDIRRLTVVILTLWMMYVASPGPVLWLCEREGVSAMSRDRLMEVTYFPIFWLGKHTNLFTTNPVGKAYAKYLDWW